MALEHERHRGRHLHLQQLLQLGILPIEADAAVWNDFGTLTNKKVEIRASKINRILGAYEVGRGLFACQDFALNEIITVYGGELITTEEARLRKENAGSQSRRYLMRISDSDFLVDGWHYASGITDAPGDDDIFLPSDQNATQWMQGAGPMANHANDANSGVNASLSFVPLANSEALRLLPRIPTLRANRPIKGKSSRRDTTIRTGCGTVPNPRMVKSGSSERAVPPPTITASWRIRMLWTARRASGPVIQRLSPEAVAIRPSKLFASFKVTHGRPRPVLRKNPA